MSTPSNDGGSRGRRRDEAIAHLAERRRLRAACRGAGFNQMKLRPPEEVGMAASGGAEDIGGKAAVSGARFDQVEHVDR